MTPPPARTASTRTQNVLPFIADAPEVPLNRRHLSMQCRKVLYIIRPRSEGNKGQVVSRTRARHRGRSPSPRLPFSRSYFFSASWSATRIVWQIWRTVSL